MFTPSTTMSRSLAGVLVLAMTSLNAGHAQTAQLEPRIAETGAELTEPRRIFTVTEVRSAQWLIVGGHLEKNPQGRASDSADMLELRDNRLVLRRVAAAMQVQRWGHRATRLKGGEVFICGGSRDTRCERYLPETEQFAPAGQLKNARSAPAQILLPSGKVLIAGGYNTGDPALGSVLGATEIFDPGSNSIAPLAPMKHPRAGHELHEFAGSIYAIGGASSGSAQIEVFDPRQGRWQQTRMHLPYSLKDFKSVAKGERIYLFGGTKDDGNSTDRVIRIDLRAGTVTEMPDRLSEPREDLAVCTVANRALIFGGEIKGNGREGDHSGAVESITFEPFAIKRTRIELFRDDAQTIDVAGGCLVVAGVDRDDQVQRAMVRIAF